MKKVKKSMKKIYSSSPLCLAMRQKFIIYLLFFVLKLNIG